MSDAILPGLASDIVNDLVRIEGEHAALRVLLVDTWHLPASVNLGLLDHVPHESYGPGASLNLDAHVRIRQGYSSLSATQRTANRGSPVSWERRKRGGLYYTRTRRQSGRQVREYWGAEGTHLAELAAEVDRLERLQREAEREALRQFRELNRQAGEFVDAVFPAAHLLLEGGCYQKKGKWKVAKSKAGLAKVDAQKKALQPLEEMTEAQLEAQDRAGRPGAEAALASLYRRTLSGKEIEQRANSGNRVALRLYVEQARKDWREGRLQQGFPVILLQGLMPGKAINHAPLLGPYEEMRQELAGPNPSAIEAMLAEAAALAWLHSMVADLKHSILAGAPEATDSPEARHWLRAGESAQRRMNRALRTLATVRRLMVPPVLLVQPAEGDLGGVAEIVEGHGVVFHGRAAGPAFDAQG